MSEWITDRKPTGDDANEDGDVCITIGGHATCCPYDNVEPGEAWRPIEPPPYSSEVTS